MPFHYQNDTLFSDEIPLESLAAEFGTPLYVYSVADLSARVAQLKLALASLKPHFHFSVKANSNLTVLKHIHQRGFGFDVVSGGELARLQHAGIPTTEVSFAGVGKTISEIQCALNADIDYFTVESTGELARIAGLAAEMGKLARVVLRLNPNVEVDTHKFITTGHAENKFGMDFATAANLSEQYLGHPYIEIRGFHLHIGSQIRQVKPYVEAAKKAVAFISARRAAGQSVDVLDLGGGFGIDYQGGAGLPLSDLATALQPVLAGRNLQLVFEPGRWLIAPTGALLMTVQYLKRNGRKDFVVVDAGMHTMIRPALYGGQHRIVPLKEPQPDSENIVCDVVGPICESTDFLAQDHCAMPPVRAGDTLALLDAGAYGMVMASNYNSHPRPAEVLVDGDSYRLVRRRETLDDLFRVETMID